MKDTIFYKKHSLNIGGKLLDLSTPKVMGILNATPDSFYDGGKYSEEHLLLKQAEKHLKEGASILDIGGQSTRPGAEFISADEEIKRVIPAIQSIVKHFPEAIISLDTFYSKVAEAGINEGVHIINDVSSGSIDSEIFKVVLEHNIPYIATHFSEVPQNTNVAVEVTLALSKIKADLFQKGFKDLIIDPGFGFGKTMEQNFELMGNLNQLLTLNLPILVGISRKSMIWKTLKTTPENALNGTTLLNTIALLKGANILRVHDVKEALECVKLIQAIP